MSIILSVLYGSLQANGKICEIASILSSFAGKQDRSGNTAAVIISRRNSLNSIAVTQVLQMSLIHASMR